MTICEISNKIPYTDTLSGNCWNSSVTAGTRVMSNSRTPTFKLDQFFLQEVSSKLVLKQTVVRGNIEIFAFLLFADFII